jgi:hypothetical protein
MKPSLVTETYFWYDLNYVIGEGPDWIYLAEVMAK